VYVRDYPCRFSGGALPPGTLFASRNRPKPNEGYPSLLKPFFKKYFFTVSFCQPWPATHRVGHPAGKGSLKKAKVGKSRVFPKIKDCLIPFPVLPSNFCASEFLQHQPCNPRQSYATPRGRGKRALLSPSPAKIQY
jgi:hypothetical protein